MADVTEELYLILIYLNSHVWTASLSRSALIWSGLGDVAFPRESARIFSAQLQGWTCTLRPIFKALGSLEPEAFFQDD